MKTFWFFKNNDRIIKKVPSWSEEAQAAVLLLIADIRLDERVRDPGLHSVQGTFKVSGLDLLGFDVLL